MIILNEVKEIKHFFFSYPFNKQLMFFFEVLYLWCLTGFHRSLDWSIHPSIHLFIHSLLVGKVLVERFLFNKLSFHKPSFIVVYYRSSFIQYAPTQAVAASIYRSLPRQSLIVDLSHLQFSTTGELSIFLRAGMPPDQRLIGLNR